MTETTQKEIKRLANKYSVHGITAETIAHIVETAPEDMSEHAALVGARMCLALETGGNRILYGCGRCKRDRGNRKGNQSTNEKSRDNRIQSHKYS